MFAMTFRTAAAYLIAKVRLYDTFNISFKVRVFLSLFHIADASRGPYILLLNFLNTGNLTPHTARKAAPSKVH